MSKETKMSLLGFLYIYLISGAGLAATFLVSHFWGDQAGLIASAAYLVLFVSLFWIGRSILERVTGARAGIWEMVWYLLGLPIVVTFALSAVFLLIQSQIADIPVPPAWLGTIFSDAVFISLGAALFRRRHKL